MEKRGIVQALKISNVKHYCDILKIQNAYFKAITKTINIEIRNI